VSSNSLGRHFVVTCFGESHGRCVGAVVDGCPPGLTLSDADVQRELDKRRPAASGIFTPRREEDQVELYSGVFEGHTTGAPICMLVWNREVDSRPYEAIRWTPRPGHADYPARLRYRGFNDYRGGGRFSGRLTAAYVMAGAVAKRLLAGRGIEVLAHVVQIGSIDVAEPPSVNAIRDHVYANPMRCADEAVARLMEQVVQDARDGGDSVGGVVEGCVLNVPPGVGHPLFNALDADLAKALFTIPAVKGVEFGAGFKAARLTGSQNNDAYAIKDGQVVTLTNNAGGILGGLSTGMPILFRVAFKPTPSISKPQQTVDVQALVETEIEVKGRHDACIVPRAVPIVEAMAAITVVDHLLAGGFL
jgi:chorismate synthase